MSTPKANHLLLENSPYLQQHAYNPVAWHPWSTSLLEMAAQQNKPLLISIGYAACHWCHVMEHECFEDTEVAHLMNTHFINVKIDREEHPDIDQTYMNALQLIQNSGGWPLNIVALPDGRPFWGSTYVRKTEWMQVLAQLAQLYHEQHERVTEYAERLQKGLRIFNLVEKPEENFQIQFTDIQQTVNDWSNQWDPDYGANEGAPKFMMPVQWEFLLHYNYIEKTKALAFLWHTLTKMAYGGIYDAVGGGFSRYSVDEKWHIPHFEKMLYDNAQLISLYAKAYTFYKHPLYKEVVQQTLLFIERELTHENTIAYASLDADSLNSSRKPEEGAFYTWTAEELKTLTGSHYELFAKVYNINSFGYWENEKYVLIKTKSVAETALELGLEEAYLQGILNECLTHLLEARNKRHHPGLDHKIITSWNALLAEGYVQAYYTCLTIAYLEKAKGIMKYILNNLTDTEGRLLRSYNTRKNIPGYLEDYALVIQALLALYEATGEMQWLTEAKAYTNLCLDEFYDPESGLFYFTSNRSQVVVQRNIEKADNVIPASNSVMAGNLYKLGIYYGLVHYQKIHLQMVRLLLPEALPYPRSYANWLKLALWHCTPVYEVVIIGHAAMETVLNMKQYYLPHVVFALSKTESDLPIFKNRYKPNETLIYVCTRNSCQLPVTTIAEALKLTGHS